MKIAVTGGSGFIGSYFYDLLSSQGHEVVILDLVPPHRPAPRATYVPGDIRDEGACRRAFAGCERVLHLAAAHHDFGIAREEYFSVNEGGTGVIARVMEELGITSACFYSTVAVYGTAPRPLTETSVPQPVSPYGQSKLAGEGVLRAWAEGKEGRTCLVIRPTVTFGPRNFANMYSLIRQIERKRFLPIGSGTNIKSLSYVENIVDATDYLWGLGEAGGKGRVGPGFHVFNYIDKPDLTSRQIVDAVYRSLGRRPPGFNVPLWFALLAGLPFDLAIAVTGKNLPVSTARMRKLCEETKFEADKIRHAGFRPKHTLEEGIRRMVAWYEAEGRYQKPVGPASAG